MCLRFTKEFLKDLQSPGSRILNNSSAAVNVDEIVLSNTKAS